MSVSSKISSALRNAFSYAVYQESSDDRLRKPFVIDAIIEASTPFLDTSAKGYEDRLREILTQTRTRFLDVLQEKKVAIGLDARFTRPAGEGINDRLVEGAYYPAKDGAPAIATLWDTGRTVKGNFFTPDSATHGATFVEKLARLLQEGEPKETLYASSLTTVDAAGGVGLVAIVTTTDWETAAQLGAARKNTAAVTQPPVKPVAPKPN